MPTRHTAFVTLYRYPGHREIAVNVVEVQTIEKDSTAAPSCVLYNSRHALLAIVEGTVEEIRDKFNEALKTSQLA